MAIKATGTVKFFSATKHFGFILREGSPDLFVHEEAVISSGFTVEQMVAGAPIEFEEGTDASNRTFAALINAINGISGTPTRVTNYLVSQPLTSSVVVFNKNDVVFGRISEVKTEGAVLSIVARLRRDNTLARYLETRLPSLLVPWVMVPEELQSNFTIEEGFYYKLIVETDVRQQRYGRALKVATDDDAPAQPDEVEPVALTGIGSRGQPIMELGDRIDGPKINFDLPPEIIAHAALNGSGLATAQPAGHA